MELFKEDFTKTYAFRICIILLVSLVLLLPQKSIQNIIEERSETHDETVNKIQDSYGGNQSFNNIYVSIPAKDTLMNQVRRVFHVVPQMTELQVNSEVEQRYYGMYKTPIYVSDLHINSSINIESLRNQIEDYHYLAYKEAELVVEINDKNAINQLSDLSINEHEKVIEINPSDSKSCVKIKSPLEDLNKQQIAISLQLRGSEMMSFRHIGKTMNLEVTSNWPHPGFTGDNLPSDRNINDSGFSARWSLPEFNSSTKDYYINEPPINDNGAFGVSFIDPVDIYLLTNRSIKYAYLLIILSFMIIYLSEYRLKLQLNPFVYFLIGLAIIMFYSFLLSLTEHIQFGYAYVIGGFITIFAIAMYIYRLLKSIHFSAFIVMMLGMGYTYIYFILQMESYSLLAGNLGVFFILLLIMIITSSKAISSRIVQQKPLHTDN